MPDASRLGSLVTPLAAGRRVAVIEDNLEHRYMYTFLLGEVGYQVREAADGLEGLLLVKDWLPDAIVLDVMLPRLDGWQLAHIVRRDERTREIPIVIVTVRGYADDRARTHALGHALHLTKPIVPTDVVRAVHGLLGIDVERPMAAPARDEVAGE